MRILYLTTKEFDNGTKDGVVKKIRNQMDCFIKAGHDVNYTYLDAKNKTMHFVSDNDIEIGSYSSLGGVYTKKIIASFLKNHLNDIKYDCSYIRFLGGRTDPWHLKILSLLHSHGIKVVLEMPTYPYDNEGSRFETFIDRMFRYDLKKYTDRIVTYSSHSEIFGIGTINTKNGVDVDSIRRKACSSDTNETINLIAVSSFINYHGYERLLTGLGEYYKGNKEVEVRDVVLHMVGDGSEMDYYKQIVADYHIEDKVVFYGFQSGDALDAIYDKADIAVGSLGIYKIGLETVSSIKTKEYISRGLPIVAGFYEIGLFDENTEFFLNVGNNESNVDISTIIDWYDKILDKYGDKEKLVDTIRQYAYDNADMSIVMKPVVDYLSE